MLLIVVLILIVALAWFFQTDYWGWHGDLVKGGVLILAILAHLIALAAALLGHGQYIDWPQ